METSMTSIHGFGERGPKQMYLTVFTFLMIIFPGVVLANPAHCDESDNSHGCVCVLEDESIHMKCINTNLTDIPTDMTDPLKMTFNQNKFEILTKVAYPNLKHLDLEQNEIRYIKENSFIDLGNLESLILSNNLISGLHKGTFTGLSSLKHLVLSNNPLEAIPRETFLASDLPAINILVMKACELHHIDDNSFDTLGTIQQLNLSNNGLIVLPAFGANLTRLTVLNMGYNKVRDIADNQFQHLSSLRQLTLSYNKITYISKLAFSGLEKSLRHLYLRHNRINLIDGEAFVNLKSLSVLDLVYNMISLLRENHIPWTTLERPLLHNNPWECTCENSWLITQKAVFLYNTNENNTMKCSYPKEWIGQDIYSIPDNVLAPCDVRHMTYLSAGAGVAIAVVAIAVLVVSVLIIRQYRIRKRARGQAIMNNANYRRMEDEARLEDMNTF